MVSLVIASLVASLLFAGHLQATVPQDKWEAADNSVVRLSPTTFPWLPKNIVDYLSAHNCKVPQPFDATEPANVISGEFMRRGQVDWAVMCSRNRTSSILIFWGGSKKKVAEIAEAPDFDFLQTIDGNDTIGFSRGISAVNRDYILQHYRWYGGPKPPHMDHQGIDDAFIGKASTVLFYHKGRWLRLQGAD
jgi:hypothetical protein